MWCCVDFNALKKPIFVSANNKLSWFPKGRKANTLATAKYANYGIGRRTIVNRKVPHTYTHTHTFHLPLATCVALSAAPVPHLALDMFEFCRWPDTISGQSLVWLLRQPKVLSFFFVLRFLFRGGGNADCCHVLFIVFCLTKHPLVATEVREALLMLHPLLYPSKGHYNFHPMLVSHK